jgi:hypothetical protein
MHPDTIKARARRNAQREKENPIVHQSEPEELKLAKVQIALDVLRSATCRTNCDVINAANKRLLAYLA